MIEHHDKSNQRERGLRHHQFPVQHSTLKREGTYVGHSSRGIPSITVKKTRQQAGKAAQQEQKASSSHCSHAQKSSINRKCDSSNASRFTLSDFLPCSDIPCRRKAGQGTSLFSSDFLPLCCSSGGHFWPKRI